NSSKIKAFEFFCGAGGLTRGFLNAGIEVLAGIDFDATLKATYERIIRVINTDIRSIDVLALRKQFGVTGCVLSFY
ncbi:MAG: DNA cytosine methyltransferase, partial [Chloroherpetonaceae bacterium]